MMYYSNGISASTFINRPRPVIYGGACPYGYTNSFIQPAITCQPLNRPFVSQVFPRNYLQTSAFPINNGIKLAKSFVGTNPVRMSCIAPITILNPVQSPRIIRQNPYYSSMYINNSQPVVPMQFTMQNTNNQFAEAMNKTNRTIQQTIERFSPKKIYSTAKKEEVNQYETENVHEGHTHQFDQNDVNQEEDKETNEIHILRYEDGFVYEGSAIESQRNGFGVLKNQEGMIVYLGNWKNDSFHGEGELRNISVEDFTGSFDYADFGELGDKWAKYEGEFCENAFSGKGELMLTNGEKFVGQFEEGRIQGEGIFYTLSGEIISGKWNDNILESRFS